jgi:hypothetical protein
VRLGPNFGTLTWAAAISVCYRSTAYLHPARFSAGFGTASLISAGLCLAGAALAALTIRNPRPRARPAPPHRRHCALDAPPPPAADHR